MIWKLPHWLRWRLMYIGLVFDYLRYHSKARYKAGVRLHTGDAVYFSADGSVKTCNLSKFEPIGIAAHDILEGDLIEYRPNENTRDILTRFSHEA